MENNLRKFSMTSPVSYCFESKVSPLIKISKKGEINYYKTKTEKRNALTERLKSDKFIISWSGQWSTDVFELTESDILTALTL
jgi:hypothetical protein